MKTRNMTGKKLAKAERFMEPGMETDEEWEKRWEEDAAASRKRELTDELKAKSLAGRELARAETFVPAPEDARETEEEDEKEMEEAEKQQDKRNPDRKRRVL